MRMTSWCCVEPHRKPPRLWRGARCWSAQRLQFGLQSVNTMINLNISREVVADQVVTGLIDRQGPVAEADADSTAALMCDDEAECLVCHLFLILAARVGAALQDSAKLHTKAPTRRLWLRSPLVSATRSAPSRGATVVCPTIDPVSASTLPSILAAST
jgi:hypothetical protein